MDAAAVEVRGLRKAVAEGTARHAILDGVDLTLAPGAAVALLGRSGAGKTTLLNLIAGLDLPDAGTVAVAGQGLDALGEAGRARLRQRRIGFVFQAFHLLPTLTVAENVALPLDLQGRLDAAGRARVAELLQRIGLPERAGAFPAVLSGGEQQRVALARALVTAPAVVLADEPTGNLDDEAAAAVLSLLRELRGRSALLLATHSARAAAICDRTLRLEHGRLVPGPAAEFPP
jgi:putative ABC transport system ATP-binding protein